MDKKELTLEELKAKKDKRQRGWVRFCAIVLAVALTFGIYKGAAKGGPRKQKLNPSVVQVSGPTVIQKVEGSNPSTDAQVTPDAPTPEEPAEGGGFLDTIMGLLGGIDFGSIMETIGGIFGQLGDLDGGSIADKLDTATGQLVEGINKFEDSIKPITAPEHPAEAIPFETESDLVMRNEVAMYLNSLSAEMVNHKVGYTIKRANTFTEDGHVDIGAQTKAVDDLIRKATGTMYTLDDVALAVSHGTRGGTPDSFKVKAGSTMDEQFNALSADKQKQLVNFQLAQLSKTALTAADLNMVTVYQYVENPQMFAVTMNLQGVKNPKRDTTIGLAGLTKDFVVRDELAKSIADSTAIQGNEFGILKLIDFETRYENATLTLVFDRGTVEAGVLPKPVSMTVKYDGRGKFTVRNNSVMLTGKATTVTTTTYSDFAF